MLIQEAPLLYKDYLLTCTESQERKRSLNQLLKEKEILVTPYIPLATTNLDFSFHDQALESVLVSIFIFDLFFNPLESGFCL